MGRIQEATPNSQATFANRLFRNPIGTLNDDAAEQTILELSRSLFNNKKWLTAQIDKQVPPVI